MTALRQRTDAWREAKRGLVTATDITVILGLSPYKSEATLARQKLGEIPETTESLLMRVGAALEPVIQEEYERATGAKLRRYHGIVYHPQIEWAAASPDWRRIGERRLVEGKTSQSRRWDGQEPPDDALAQVQWQMGVTGMPAADVALLARNELRVWTVEAEPDTFAGMVSIAADFRRRLAEGGPFAEDAASIKARYPADDGTEMIADAELTEAVNNLVRLRAQRKDVAEAEDRLETAIKARMGPIARLTGPGFSVTWKKAKDTELTDWRLIADGLLRQMPETERTALVGLHSMVREGARYFRITVKGETE